MTTAAPNLDTAAMTAAGVLEDARADRAVADAAEARLLSRAVAWADLHPAESIHDAALLSRHGDQPLAIAGPGAPLVAEFCVAEFALAVGLPTETGKAYLGEAVELAHRLPRTWKRVLAGDLTAWRARRIARETIGVSMTAASFVDSQVAPFAHRIRPSEVDRLVADAVGRFMPAEAEALDLETAVARGAAVLAACGSQELLNVRRSQALGEIARRQTSSTSSLPMIRTTRWLGRPWSTCTFHRAARSPGSRPAAAGS